MHETELVCNGEKKISAPCRSVVGRIHCIIIFIHRSFKRYSSVQICRLCLCFVGNKNYIRRNKYSRFSVRRTFALVSLGQLVCNLRFMLNNYRRNQFASTYCRGGPHVATGSAVVAKNRFQCSILIVAYKLGHVDQYITGQ